LSGARLSFTDLGLAMLRFTMAEICSTNLAKLARVRQELSIDLPAR